MEQREKEIMQELGFGKQIEDVEAGLCPFCQKPVKVDDFTDEISLKEFGISGICQTCQNETFKAPTKEK